MSAKTTRENLWPLGITLAALSIAWLPHARRLPPWLGPVLAALVAVRFAYGRFGWKLPSRMWLLVPTAAGALWAIFAFRPFFGGTGAIALLTVMASLKLFEMQEARDRAVVALLGYVLVATRFIYEQTPLTALWMLGLAFAFTYVLIENNDRTGLRPKAAKAKEVGRLFLWALPVALVLFLVFPRVGSPLLTIRGKGGATTGLSGEMRPGSISSLAESEEIAFRASIEEEGRIIVEHYWRGPVFEDFDGLTWRPASFRAVAPAPAPPSAARVRQLIQTEDTGTRWITPLDRPVVVSGEFAIGADGAVRTAGGSRVQAGAYPAVSMVGDLGEELTEDARRRNLDLPLVVSPRVLELAGRLAEGAGSDGLIVTRALGHFRGGGYAYTLTPPTLGDDPVDEFLFETKKGFCEHYASAMTLLLRAAGVPARVVTGYLGGEFNPFGSHWIVQQRHAHAWVEAHLKGRGWVRVDPTAAVSPERLAGAIDFAASLRDGVVRFSGGGAGLIAGMRHMADYFGYWWNDWVVGFGPVKQKELLSRLGLSSVDSIAWLALACVAAPLSWFGLLYAAQTWAARRRLDPADRLWLAFCAKLARRGVERGGSEPPYAFARRAAGEMPKLAGDILNVANLYSRHRYGRRRGEEELAALRRAVARFGGKK